MRNSSLQKPISRLVSQVGMGLEWSCILDDRRDYGHEHYISICNRLQPSNEGSIQITHLFFHLLEGFVVYFKVVESTFQPAALEGYA